MSAYTDCMVFCSVSTRTTEVKFHVSGMWHTLLIWLSCVHTVHRKPQSHSFMEKKAPLAFLILIPDLFHISASNSLHEFDLSEAHSPFYNVIVTLWKTVAADCSTPKITALWPLTGSWGLTQEQWDWAHFSFSMQKTPKTIMGNHCPVLFWWSWMRGL